MPKNKNLNPVSLPMELKFGQEPRTEFYNNLQHLKVELIDAPTRSQALNVAWQYVKATWADHHDETNPSTASLKELSANLEDVLNFRALPTPMECFIPIYFERLLSNVDTLEPIKYQPESITSIAACLSSSAYWELIFCKSNNLIIFSKVRY